MIKNATILLLAGLLTCCAGSPSENFSAGSPETSAHASTWFDIGYKEAIEGNLVKENASLSEWYGETEINRTAFLEGYAKGQTELCQDGKIATLARKKNPFPASCDSVNSAVSLKQIWLQHSGN